MNPIQFQRSLYTTLVVALFVIGMACAGRQRAPANDVKATPAGVSTKCLKEATDKFKTCTDACKGKSDASNCCGECDLEFATTFQNCCKEHCKVNNPPPDCSDDSGPGCAGGVITPDMKRPDWCEERPEGAQTNRQSNKK